MKLIKFDARGFLLYIVTYFVNYIAALSNSLKSVGFPLLTWSRQWKDVKHGECWYKRGRLLKLSRWGRRSIIIEIVQEPNDGTLIMLLLHYGIRYDNLLLQKNEVAADDAVKRIRTVCWRAIAAQCPAYGIRNVGNDGCYEKSLAATITAKSCSKCLCKKWLGKHTGRHTSRCTCSKEDFHRKWEVTWWRWWPR